MTESVILFPFYASITLLRSSKNSVLQASEGILQSPRGDRDTEPTLGQSGRQDLLNCCAKNLLTNVLSHLSIVSSS